MGRKTPGITAGYMRGCTTASATTSKHDYLLAISLEKAYWTVD